MKTIILTLVLVCLVSMSNVSGKDNTDIYTNTEVDAVKNSRTTVSCKGLSEMNLELDAKYVKYSDINGNPKERVYYKWDSSENDWIPTKRYEYVYNEDNKLEAMNYVKWNRRTNSWDNDIQCFVYLYSPDGNFLTILK